MGKEIITLLRSKKVYLNLWLCRHVKEIPNNYAILQLAYRLPDARIQKNPSRERSPDVINVFHNGLYGSSSRSNSVSRWSVAVF